MNNLDNNSENNPEINSDYPSQPETPEESHPISTEAPKGAEKNKKGWLATGFAVLMAFLGKFKFLVIFLKLGKILTTSSTMLLSVWAYTLLYPLPFAIGFVLLIFIHEMGHLLVLTRYGLKASAPVFIPFMGAMIAMKDMPKNVEMEAWVGYGGPFIGGLAALLCFGIAYFLPESFPEAKELLYALAHVGFLINLFNLIPIPPMDGGRITAALSRWFWILGWIVSLGWFILGNHHPILLIILFVGGVQIFKTFWKKEEDVDKSYYNIDPTTRFYIAAAYFSLVMALSYMSFYTNDLLEHLRQF